MALHRLDERAREALTALLFAAVLSTALHTDRAFAGPQRSVAERKQGAYTRLLKNISPTGARPGAVIAATGGNHEYQFNWIRDAAFAMSAVAGHLENAPRGKERTQALKLYGDYVNFTLHTIAEPTQAGLGEPKFHLNGGAFQHPWGRPQNDGPALRALTNLRFANWLMSHRKGAQVRRDLFGGRGQLLVEKDLDYVAAHWRDKSYDVWEEELADHFYTRAVQATALLRGARLADRLGHREASARYRAAGEELRSALDQHWDARYSLIRSSLNRESGVPHKWTGLDSAVILAAIHTYGEDSPLHVLDERILSTAALLEVDFRNKLPINAGKRGAIAMGRYPEDEYTGQPGQDRKDGGNAWVLTTNAFGEYYYRVAAELRRATSFQVTAVNRKFVLGALGEPEDSSHLPVGTQLMRGDPALVALATAVLKKGDGFLATVSHLVGDEAQSEQMHRDNGRAVGATELTWNYASSLSALAARADAVRAR
jgi:glucoamylase